MQATLRVELVEEREEVVLVGAAAVEQDERAHRLPGGRALPYLQAQARTVRPRIRQRGEQRLDAVAQVLERRRQDQLLAEMRRILVGREPGPERRDLEQDAGGSRK